MTFFFSVFLKIEKKNGSRFILVYFLVNKGSFISDFLAWLSKEGSKSLVLEHNEKHGKYSGNNKNE